MQITTVDFCESKPNLKEMIRLFILAVLSVAIVLFISKLLSKKKDDDVIDGEVIEAEAKSSSPSLLPILLLGVTLACIGLFVLPRLGISAAGLLQKGMALLLLIRGFLPF